MFSFKHGTPFSIINGGQYDDKILYYDEEDSTDEIIEMDPIQVLRKNDFFKNNTKTKRKYNNFLTQFKKNPTYDTIAYDIIAQRKGKELDFVTGESLDLIPNYISVDKRTTVYITGPSGTGKTYFACQFLRRYKEAFPDRPIYIFTNAVDDPTIKECSNFSPHLINLRETITNEKGKEKYKLLEQPLAPDDFEDCAVLFDDIQYIEHKELRKNLLTLHDALLGCGRKKNVTVVITSQTVTDYLRTRLILNESEWVVIYPKSGLTRGLDYFFRSYLGIKEKSEIMKRILHAPSRWVCLHTRNPQFAFYTSGGFMFNYGYQ